MQIVIPEFTLLVIVGEEQGIQTFINKHFQRNEVINPQNIETQVISRLELGQLTVIPLVTFEKTVGQHLAQLAKRCHYTPMAVVVGKDYLLTLEGERNECPKEEIKQSESIISMLGKVGFKTLYHLETLEMIEHTSIQYRPLANNKRKIHGPFDIIGDVHGCYDELCTLLDQLGYRVDKKGAYAYPPDRRKLAFVGDLVDRGPKTPQVLKLVMHMVTNEQAYCVLGNHDGKLLRKLRGSNVQVIHGLETTMEQLAQEPEWFSEKVKIFLEGLVSHYVFDEGKLVVAHAGLKEHLHGRESKKIRDLAMFGETTGELDAQGLPVRLNWSEDYKGDALVVYGHTPKKEAEHVHHTINIDTGCVYGGKLTAFRYPEDEIVSVKAKKVYYPSARPFL